MVWGDDGDADSEGSREGDDDSFVEEFDDDEVRGGAGAEADSLRLSVGVRVS